MNTFSRSALVVIACFSALLCTACSNSQENNSQISTGYTYTGVYTTRNWSSRTETTTAMADAAASLMAADESASGSFRSAIWLAKDSAAETERYFFFVDETHGKVRDQQNGQETPFTYTLTDGSPSFQIGSEPAKTVRIFWIDADRATVVWEGGRTESLSVLRENVNEPFQVFSNEQLCSMALQHYAAHHEAGAAHARVFYNLDEAIAVQLYNGDGNASDTLDWYTVDRFTGNGYDTLNQPVSLTDRPAESAPAQTTPAQTTAVQTTVQTTIAETTTVPPLSSLDIQTVPAMTTDVTDDLMPFSETAEYREW